jgi:hypothetical protein
MSATKRTLILTLAFTTLALAGCQSWRKENRAKNNKAVVAEVEESFRQRWIERRAAELMNRGVSPNLARSQAIEEFRLNYGFTGAAKQ